MRDLRTYHPIAEAASGGYVLSTYEDVAQAFSNEALGNTPSRFSALRKTNAAKYEAADYALHALPFRDGPGHQKARKACMRAMGAHSAPSSDVMTRIAEDILANITRQKEHELISEISTPYATNVMCDWFGFDRTDGSQLARWSQSIFRLFAPLSDRSQLDKVNDDIASFRAYIRSALDAASADQNLLANLVQHASSHETETIEAIDNAILIFMDGMENVRYGAGNVVMELFSHQDILNEFASSQNEAERATQEALRLHSPASIISRVAAEDTTIKRTEIKAGTPVFLLLGSANRDEYYFEEADSFNPSRRGKASVLFGQGTHSCLGGNLAISMIGALVRSLIQSGFKRATNVSDANYIKRFGHRWPEAVSIHQ